VTGELTLPAVTLEIFLSLAITMREAKLTLSVRPLMLSVCEGLLLAAKQRSRSDSPCQTSKAVELPAAKESPFDLGPSSRHRCRE
jgi:hypothetical protein